MTASNERLEARARAIRSRAAVRAWEIRQHGHARGVWFEIERLFALTSRAWTISEADVEALMAAGRRPAEAGLRLHPLRRFFVVTAEEIATLTDAREIEVALSSEIVSAPALALVPFA